jgi:hypothetical protein
VRAPVDGEAFLVGRTAERMRSEIRVRFGFREATIADADALKEGDKDQTLEKENWKVVYDKNELRPSHLISTFMKTLGHADLVRGLERQTPALALLHDRVARTYQNAKQEKREFLNRIIPLVLKDAQIGTWRGRAEHAEHWRKEFA